ncbi:MAG TPA: cytochrome c peroxidase [Methylocystis sp.]|nr:cytochrome c peroxidase [Methylocystis sp.]
MQFVRGMLRFILGQLTPLLAACFFAAPSVAAEDHGLERLGAQIFADTELSEPRGQACASCHDPKHAFFGVNRSTVTGVARGASGALGVRKPPSAMYASFSPPFSFIDKEDEETGKMEKTPAGGQFRDGRAMTLEQQAAGPLLNPVEMNNPSKAAVVAKVKAGVYADAFRAVFGRDAFDDPDAAFDKITRAIAAYERTEVFHPFASKFDDVLRGEAKFTPLEAEGFGLFKNKKKGNCLACHVGEVKSRQPKDWLFTDFTFDTLGAPRNPAIPANAKPDYYDLGLCRREGLAALAPEGFEIDSVCGAFKVPTLRNVALAAPYFHNGSVATLREAVEFYATRDTDPKRWWPRTEKFDDLPETYHGNVNVKEVPYDRKPGQRPRLSPHEIDAITAFLQALTDRPPQ